MISAQHAVTGDTLKLEHFHPPQKPDAPAAAASWSVFVDLIRPTRNDG